MRASFLRRSPLLLLAAALVALAALFVGETPQPARAQTPTIEFAQYTSAIGEGEGAETYAVTLSAVLGSATSVGISILDKSTATETHDYTLSTKTLNFAAGETTQTFTVTAVDDQVPDDAEELFLKLVAITSAPYTLGVDSELQITIFDPAEDLLIAAGYIARRGASEQHLPVTVTVDLNDAAPMGGTTVTLSIGAASTATEGAAADFTLSPKTLTIAEGEYEATATLTIIDDSVDDNGETIVLQAASTNPAYTARDLTIRILDNDPWAAPAAPAGVTVQPGGGELTVAWTVPGSSPAGDADYQVQARYRVKSPQGSWTERTFSRTERDAGSATLAGLSGVAHEVQVRFLTTDPEGMNDRADNPVFGDPVISLEVAGARSATAEGTPGGLPLGGPSGRKLSGLTMTADGDPVRLISTSGMHDPRPHHHFRAEVPFDVTQATVTPVWTTAGDVTVTVSSRARNPIGGMIPEYTATTRVQSSGDSVTVNLHPGKLPEDVTLVTIRMALDGFYEPGFGAATGYVIAVRRGGPIEASLSVTPNPVAEGGSRATIIVTLSQPAPFDMVIPLTVSHGTSEPGDWHIYTPNAFVRRGETTSAPAGTPGEFYADPGTTFIQAQADDDAEDETLTVALGTLPQRLTAGATTSVTVTITDDDRSRGQGDDPRAIGEACVPEVVLDPDTLLPVLKPCPETETAQQQEAANPHAELIAQIYAWRNDPEAQRWGRAHTDRWDRALKALGETVADPAITAMTAAEAQALADQPWATRWIPVAEALRALEAAEQNPPPVSQQQQEPPSNQEPPEEPPGQPPEQANRAPTLASPLADLSGLEAGTSLQVSLSGVFGDPDGDALTITAASSNEAAVTVSVASGGSSLTLTGVAQGSATITVTAQDPHGERVSDRFEVTVAAPASTLSEVAARYDADASGAIDVSEYRRAVDDYSARKISYAELLEVVKAYSLR